MEIKISYQTLKDKIDKKLLDNEIAIANSKDTSERIELINQNIGMRSILIVLLEMALNNK